MAGHRWVIFCRVDVAKRGKRGVLFIMACLFGGCSLLHPNEGSLTVRTDKEQYHVGEQAMLRVINRTDESVRVVFICSYQVQQKKETAWETIHVAVCPPNVRVGAIEVKAGATYNAQVPINVDDGTTLTASKVYRLRFTAFFQDGSALSDEAASSNAFGLTQ